MIILRNIESIINGLNLKRMKTILFKIVLLPAFLLMVPLSLLAGNIVYPWRAVKCIVKCGDSFQILYDNTNSTEVDSLILEGPFNRVKLQIDSISSGKYEFDTFTHSAVNTKVYTHIPENTPEELYNLILKNSNETAVSPVSVKVIKEYNKNQRFIHITDLHMTRQWVGSPQDGYAKELELFDSFTRVANIISPDFVIITGDLIHDYTRINADAKGWGGITLQREDEVPAVETKWRNCYEGANGFSGINGLNSPVYAVPGNHDFYGVKANDYLSKAKQWNKFCGIRVYGFSYGNTRVIAADDFLGDPLTDIPDKSPMSGLQGKVLQSFLNQKGPGSVRIMAQHRYDRVDTAFIDQNRINILLHGHDHKPFQSYIGKTPTLNIRPGVVCRSGVTDINGELGFFRIFSINGGKIEYTPPLRFCKDPTKLVTQLELNLTLDFKNPNDGSPVRNEAVIHNSFPVDLPDCKIRFLMKKGRYKVSNGKIRQIIQTPAFSVVDVYTDVNSNTAKTVKIIRLR